MVVAVVVVVVVVMAAVVMVVSVPQESAFDELFGTGESVASALVATPGELVSVGADGSVVLVVVFVLVGDIVVVVLLVVVFTDFELVNELTTLLVTSVVIVDVVSVVAEVAVLALESAEFKSLFVTPIVTVV